MQSVEVGDDPSLARELTRLARIDSQYSEYSEVRQRLSLDRRKRQIQGIAGVEYDTIYLAIGVAATTLFIIETLYKAYQLYVSSGGGRQLGDSEQYHSSRDIL